MELRRPDCSPDIDAQIDDFLRKIKDLLGMFEAIYSLMSQTAQLTEDEQSTFKHLCRNFGKIWRSYFPDDTIPPKIHMLESHAWIQMQMFGCLGDKAEAAVERLHKECNDVNCQLRCVRKWSDRQKTMLCEKDKCDLTEVKAVRVKVMTKTSRTLTPESVQRKRVLEEEVNNVKRAKLEHNVDLVDAFVALGMEQ